MKLLKHLLRYGGLYLMGGLIYFVLLWFIPATLITDEFHKSWQVILGAHIAVGLGIWCVYGIIGGKDIV